ncbi:peptidoglycan-binding protein [Spirulina sp. CS-785/01]|uniref:peptidoglycan-binding protein n=1 Tax=Spirulina sp. CS-785/01 TaxID=3021716 RepID=UPI00232E8E05|nr:peptidoglycan-binding protein [Spirulina sp. CS-785/01]MDB9313765.1 peptidoglycan-binding protein [Spirulina sp. CS-785/01]
MESLAYQYYTAAYEAENQIEYNIPPVWKIKPELWQKALRLSRWGLAITFLLILNHTPTLALMKRGQESPAIKQLQQELQAKGYFNGPTTGYYGPLTEGAVKRFQQANNLQPDGIFGPNTESVLREVSPTSTPPSLPSKLLKKGQESQAVKELQQTLKNQGYFNGPTTGYYGPLTERAVKQFQQANNLQPDGIFGPNTRKALNGETVDATITTPFTDSNTEIKPFSEKETGEFNPEPFTDSSFTDSDSSFNEDSFTDTNSTFNESTPSSQPMTLQKTIGGNISPKSIVHSGQGLFFAQNMMYTHTITVYDRNYNLIKTIPDSINLSNYVDNSQNANQYKGIYRGSPVEAAFSHNGNYAWVSNYKMYGSGFDNPGGDTCKPEQKTDESFLYKIDTNNYTIEQAIKVGSVPKYVATTPDNRLVLVSNWCSYDLSIIDTRTEQEIKRINLGRYPRGIVVDTPSQTAYIAVMGSSHVAKVNLQNFSVSWIKNVGKNPRHLNLSPDNRYLYVSLNGEDKVAKLDLQTEQVVKKISTGDAPRTMVLSENGQYLYVVNYFSNTLSKVNTKTMEILDTVDVAEKPIGVTYDPVTNQVWVSAYSGQIMVFSG